MNPFSWKNRNRDLAVILTTFVIGLGLMLLSGTLAIGLAPQWAVKANMDSALNPDATFAASNGTQVIIEQVSSDILTQATWQAYLTPVTSTPTRGGHGGGNDGGDKATATTRPQNSKTPDAKTATPNVTVTTGITGTVTIRKTGTATRQPTASKTFIIFFPTSSNTPKVPTAKPTSTATITRTPSKTNTSTKTATFTKTVTQTATSTATKTATFTKTLTPTRTFTPTITLTPTISPTPTITPTFTATLSPTVTATWTSSLTPTITPVPTDTATPTITLTPTITPTLDPINWGSGDGAFVIMPDGGSVTYSFSPPITDHGDSGYDFVYYEQRTGPTSIALDLVIVEISQDGSSWYPVFNWGDNIADSNSSVDYLARGFGSESDNQNISGGLINGYGIGIDIYSLGLTGNYNYIRFSCPGSGSSDGCDLDAIEIYP